MWEAVELREIRVFLELADQLHFGRAAERLGVTQSRVSQSLRGLEAKLGERLLDRTSRRVGLTPAGERLLAEIDPAYERLAEALRRAARPAGEAEGTLRIALVTGVSGGERLLEIIRAFEVAHPRCSVEVKEMALSDRFEALGRGGVDLMVSRLPLRRPDLVVGPMLTREPRVLGVSADHPLSGRSEVTLEDIADYQVTDVSGMLPPELERGVHPQARALGPAAEVPAPRAPRARRADHDDRPGQNRPPDRAVVRRPLRPPGHHLRADQWPADVGDGAGLATGRRGGAGERLSRGRRVDLTATTAVAG